ncbi:MAG: inositol-phosphate phosphatase [Gammaproteobacteria bacterium]|nr:MAG: inositol-phosphate phosphatase [Gammaproteobacteria bacterium]
MASQPMLNIAINAAVNAGKVIVRYVGRIDELNITTKQCNDFVSEVDQQAEQEIIGTIRDAYPNHAILAEESGHTEGRQTGTSQNSAGEYQWVIDPLDGTTNFLHGFPQFAVSIALKYKGRLQHGVIYDPMSQEMFTASRGEGAQLNNRRIRVSSTKSLENSLLGTGFPFRDYSNLDTYLAMFRDLITSTHGIRRPGSAALDLAWLAAGRLDGFWELGLNEWDLAAGALIIQEAGGLVGDFDGGDGYLQSGNIVAGNPKIFKALLQTLAPYRKDIRN